MIDAMPITEEPVPATHAENHKADMAWAQMRAKNGWPDSTLVILLQEFVVKSQLSAQLIAYMRKRGHR